MSRPVGSTSIVLERTGERFGWDWSVEVQVADEETVSILVARCTIGAGWAFTEEGARRKAVRRIRRYARHERRRRSRIVEDGPFIDADGRLWDRPVAGVSTRTVDEFLGDDDDD